VTRNYRLLFGPVAAVVLCLGITGLAVLIPGYSHVHQTVSEIGEMSSPARVPFAIMLGCVAACILVFASAVRDVSVAAQRSQLAAYLIGFMAIPAAGTGIFAYPHPLHNIFGLSELIGYQAPLVFCTHMETRSASKNSRRTVVDLVCADMGRDRSELKFLCSTSLGLRETSPRRCSKSSFRRLVRLVRHSGHITVPAKVAEFRPLKLIANRFTTT
jgi:hypothetical membrane protein